MNDRIPWKRVALEGVVIVLSILLAFGIDAWWDTRAQADRERRHLESLVAELGRNDRLLDEAREYYEARYREASWLLSALDGSVPIDEALVETAVTGLFINRTFHLETGAHDALLASGELDLIRDDDLRSQLAAWPSYVSEWAEEQEAVFNYVANVLAPSFQDRLWLRAMAVVPSFPDGEEPPPVPVKSGTRVHLDAFAGSPTADNLIFQRAQGLWHAMRDGATLQARSSELDAQMRASLGR